MTDLEALLLSYLRELSRLRRQVEATPELSLREPQGRIPPRWIPRDEIARVRPQPNARSDTQLRRYRESLPNRLLTDYYRFVCSYGKERLFEGAAIPRRR